MRLNPELPDNTQNDKKGIKIIYTHSNINNRKWDLKVTQLSTDTYFDRGVPTPENNLEQHLLPQRFLESIFSLLSQYLQFQIAQEPHFPRSIITPWSLHFHHYYPDNPVPWEIWSSSSAPNLWPTGRIGFTAVRHYKHRYSSEILWGQFHCNSEL